MNTHCTRCRLLGPSQGMLLIEITIALAIIAVGIFAVLSVQQFQSRTGRSLGRHAIALESADGLLERLRVVGLPPANVAGQSIELDTPSEPWLSECECRLWVSDYRTDTPGLKHVRVAVSWRDRAAQRKSVAVETLMLAGGNHDP